MTPLFLESAAALGSLRRPAFLDFSRIMLSIKTNQKEALAATEFRLDLNGLRAVAVVAVLLFHFDIYPFSGGFVGVDVFFVLSGFLMTKIIKTGLDERKFSFARFYLNRLARIVPALVVVAVLCLGAGYYLLLPSSYKQLGLEVLEALSFTINFHFAATTRYFAPDLAHSWLLHCWSLAVEFQFYILFPLCLWLAKRASRDKGIPAALVVAIVGSASCSLMQTDTNQMAAFYLLPSRVWQFAVGGLILYLPVPAKKLSSLVAVSGLAAIGIAAVMFDGQLKYPSLWSALPVFGASLVIWANSSAYALRNPLSQLLGKISYSLYLWHWPILTIAHYLAFGKSGKPLELALLFAATLALSLMSFAFIEKPGRNIFRRLSLRSISLVAMASVAGSAVCAVVLLTDGWPARLSDRMFDLVSRASHDTQYRDGTCFLGPDQKFADFEAKCIDPAPGSTKPTIAIWGDSHAAHLYPGIATQPWVQKYKVVQLTASACLPLKNAPTYTRPNCPGIRAESEKLLLIKKPEVVILGGSWRGSVLSDVVVRGRPSSTIGDLHDLVVSLRKSGVGKVIVVGQINHWQLPLPAIFFANSQLRSGEWSTSLPSDYTNEQAQIDEQFKTAVGEAGGIYVSMLDSLCQGSHCRTLVEGFNGDSLLQFDSEHLTTEGSYWVAKNVVGPALGEPPVEEPPVELNEVVAFSNLATGKRFLASGWMPSEGWGTWNASKRRPGVVILPIDPESEPSAVKFKFWGQLGRKLTDERFIIKFDGDSPVETKVTLAKPIVEEIFQLGEGARQKMRDGGRLRIEFLAPDGKSPKELRLNTDERTLGFGLRELTLLP